MIPTRTTLAPEHEALLEPQLEQVSLSPETLALLSARAARTVGRGPTAHGGRVEDEVRVRLLLAATRDVDAATAARVATDLYTDGDADERRAVLLALPALDVGPRGVPLLLDALRTNDVRLVAAAMGAYAAEHLDDEAWRHGVLKCLFTGVPTDAVVDLDRRRDAELDRMVDAYVREREAAGREIPDDARSLLGAR
ncbi:hypothetical protein SAMN04489860_0252 [Paraoerskovia marina]|uniref:HEAT repeat-containing protein n=1 Tax=Paraoerskovia marina TaxID=545619 RepID=A0A1H1MIS5_9CELL|nr:EboA domain-containing protein [Paraoerskovia marina]SDR86636.1 hypothetical protein SAMN04489860_0252 [Paraoerskovia marina]